MTTQQGEIRMFLPKDLIAVRVNYYVDYTDETIALVTSELKAREAVRNWFVKHVEDEGGLNDYNVGRSENYEVYFDKIKADGTIDRGYFRKDAEFTVADVI
jgi:hypothetical protein